MARKKPWAWARRKYQFIAQFLVGHRCVWKAFHRDAAGAMPLTEIGRYRGEHGKWRLVTARWWEYRLRDVEMFPIEGE
jgi:hypothetical protein